jgi:hypothetical protein
MSLFLEQNISWMPENKTWDQKRGNKTRRQENATE